MTPTEVVLRYLKVFETGDLEELRQVVAEDVAPGQGAGRGELRLGP